MKSLEIVFDLSPHKLLQALFYLLAGTYAGVLLARSLRSGRDRSWVVALIATLIAATAAPTANAFPSWGPGVACAVAQPVRFSPAPAVTYPRFVSAGGLFVSASPSVSVETSAAVSAWHWKQSGDDFHLFRGDQMVGGYSTIQDVYCSWTGDRWGEACEPPTPVPASIRAAVGAAAKQTSQTGAAAEPIPGRSARAKAAPPAPQGEAAVRDHELALVGQLDAAREDLSAKLPTGVDWTQISKTPRVTRQGQHVPPNSLFIEGSLADDSKKDRLTFVASDKAKREAAMKAFREAPAFAGLRAACLPWETTPDDWSMECGFPKADNQVILQAASGKVLARVAVPDVGDAPAVVGALRKANPSYDPLKDPGQPNQPANPLGPLGPIGQWVPLGLLLVALAAAVWK